MAEVEMSPESGQALARAALRERTRAFYQGKTLAEFAIELGLEGKHAEHLMKNWVSKGREMQPEDLPPFHRPWELASWWRRLQAAGVMKKRPPPWMVDREELGPKGGFIGGAPSVGTPGAFMMPTFNLSDLDVDFADLDAGARMLYSMAGRWVEQMQSAIANKDSSSFYKAYGQWKETVRELRAWVKDSRREKLATGEIMEATKEMAVLGQMFSTIATSFGTAIEKLIEKLRPDIPARDRMQIMRDYRDRIFAGLNGTKFERAIPPEEIAAALPELTTAEPLPLAA